MIRLFTMKDISAFSSDAIYKICLALDKYGLSEEDIESFESYDDMYEAVMSALEKGKHIIVAAEHTDFLASKKNLITKLILESSFSPEIADFITLNAGDDVSEIDVEGHCFVPENSVVHLTADGLYSGFTCEALSGRLSFIPLDFMRLDEVLDSMVTNEEQTLAFINKHSNPFSDFADKEIELPEYDIVPAVEKLVSSLSRLGKKVALTTGEATMWIYSLYDKIDGLTDTIGFVEINDPEESSSDENEQETAFEEALQNKEDGADIEKESESMKVIRHAREAMYNTDCDFGASVSPVYSVESEDGQTSYYAYVAVVDRSTAKAKKINTANPDDVSLILPHAVSILSDVVCQKAEIISTAVARLDYSDGEDEKEEETPAVSAEKAGTFTLSKGVLIFAAVVLVFALVSPMIMTYFMLKPQTTTTNPNDIQVNNPGYYQSTNAPASTTNPFVNTTKDPAMLNGGVTENVAPEVSAISTTAAVKSDKGVFTFYVFGYGHGVGMSQIGANYLATQGWNAWQILAHYYYDASENTKIVSGDAYPAKIKYAGTEYNTRDFLASSLESEMGGSFQTEALKAQAIAIYTFAKYNGFNLSADATAFGKTPSQTVYSVIDDVMAGGYYIANGSDVAVTPFHAMSAGVTTSYYNVWGKGIGASVPYLSGGRQSYGDYLDPNFKSTYTITSDDLKKLVKENAKIDLSGDPSTWLGIITHDSAVREDIGYISSINVGGTIMTGNDFRIKVMGGRIRSHCFAFTYTPNG